MYAQVCNYRLWALEQVSTATFPLVLKELLKTVPPVPPTSVAKFPPFTCAKYAYASVYQLGNA
eukprot:1669813-Ditylum_brightwellii.AAC.1